MGTLLGAWMGAVPIPLDWQVLVFCGMTGVILTLTRDREWQKWPVTIVTGAYLGYAVGKLVGGVVLKGKKIVFE